MKAIGWIDTRFENKFAEDHDLLVMGDFNTPRITDPIFDILLSHGLKIPQSLVKLTVGDRGHRRFQPRLRRPLRPDPAPRHHPGKFQ
jgi:hypothetical protein